MVLQPSQRQNKGQRQRPNTDTSKSRRSTGRSTADTSKPRRQRNTRQSSSNPATHNKHKDHHTTKQKQKPVTKKKKKKPKELEQEVQIQEPVRRIIKPDDQLDLTDQQLVEDVSRILTGDDPNKPKNVCKFSYKDKCYKPDPPGQGDNMAIHFSLEGCSMHVDSDEYKKYKEREAKEESDGGKVSSDCQTTTTSTSSTAAAGVDHTKNQFNFSERASQTFNNPLKSVGVHTEPPPITQYQDEVSQWKIHDSYKSDFLLNQSVEQAADGGSTNALRSISFEDKLASIVLTREEPSADSTTGSSSTQQTDTIHSENMENALKTMERLVNQNAEDEIFQDFKYFEDKADEFRNGEGTLLPLWRFTADRANRKQVTSLCWNPRYNDMFAVGYGSYDFIRQGAGIVCCFSLKNTSYPEYVLTAESGVMCLDFHPQHPSLLAVGCYDGTVLAYDISNGTNKPIYSSSLRSGKHSDPVWQVYWHDNNNECLSKDLNFYSISTDGKVANWTMNKNELKMEPIMHLKLVNPSKDDPSSPLDEPTLSGLAGGCSFDFNKKLDNLFLVGTEEGSIHECSKAYSGQYIKTYDGHHMGVHTVRWNPFHEDIFISCSADWTVKIWDHKSSQCILHFDLGNAVGDVCWSPFSSTVFAAVTTDGKVHVFDLSQNKQEPLCAQKVVKRARLTNASFNMKDYILIVGDDKGGVHSLKLSPNLRKLSENDIKSDGDGVPLDNDEIQRRKIISLLASVRSGDLK